jgi:hypothetical protein
MKALEFAAKISDNSIEIPESIRFHLKSEGKQVRVILLIEDPDDKDWKDNAAKQFLSGYSDSDSIYDSY